MRKRRRSKCRRGGGGKGGRKRVGGIGGGMRGGIELTTLISLSCSMGGAITSLLHCMSMAPHTLHCRIIYMCALDVPFSKAML